MRSPAEVPWAPSNQRSGLGGAARRPADRAAAGGRRRPGNGVLIATMDTGANGIPDLRGALVPGYDFVDNDFEPQDTHDGSHGTRVASVLAARQQRASGWLAFAGAGAGAGERERVGEPRPGSPSGSATPSTAAPASSTSASATRAAPTRRRRPPSSITISRGVVVASAGNAGTEAPRVPARTPACSPSGRATTLTTSISWSAAAPG